MTAQEARLITTPELKKQLNFFVVNKIWQGDYFVLNTEVQRRATASWVHEDVFGEPYEWDVNLQKFIVPAPPKQAERIGATYQRHNLPKDVR